MHILHLHFQLSFGENMDSPVVAGYFGLLLMSYMRLFRGMCHIPCSICGNKLSVNQPPALQNQGELTQYAPKYVTICLPHTF